MQQNQYIHAAVLRLAWRRTITLCCSHDFGRHSRYHGLQPGFDRQRGGVGGMVQILEESWILIIVILAAVLTTGLVLTVKKLERDDKRWPHKGPDK
jgi:hypothetical protein